MRVIEARVLGARVLGARVIGARVLGALVIGALLSAPACTRAPAADAGMMPAMKPQPPVVDVAMVGDSHVEWGDWRALLGREGIAEHGIGGQTSADILARLGPIVAARPRVLVLVLGSNDLLRGRPTEDTVRDVEAILDTIARGSPATRVVFTSVLPMDAARMQWQIAPAQVDALNARLRPLIEARGARWHDLHPLFRSPRGTLTTTASSDGLHLSAAGYRAWADALEELLRP